MEQTMHRVDCGKLEGFPVGSNRAILVEGKEIALFRLGSGEICAVENRCPHKGGRLSEGIVSGEHVFCPLHDWKICLQDGLVQAPDTGCVKRYAVQVAGGKVYLTLE